MSWLDWLVLLGTLAFIVIYGALKTRKSHTMENYLKGDGTMKWWQIGISVMATQASAITFISTPGQAYDDGMRFIQFYFGLPVAMIVISAFIIPIFYRLNIVTAYEYLESRFDLKVRWLAAGFFLLQRGLAAGITIYAPSIILSTVLGVDLNLTNIFIGVLVIIYTVTGGADAVNVTQRHQMAVMMIGLLLALGIVIFRVSEHVGVGAAVQTAGALGKLNFVDWKFDPDSRYNIWTGLIGGFFLSLSYFGTDQSQVGRYLGGKSVTQSRLGLLFNGMFKIPMQLLILFTGVMVFVFYLYVQPPVFFNKTELRSLENSSYAGDLHRWEQEYNSIYNQKTAVVRELSRHPESREMRAEFSNLQKKEKAVRDEVKKLATLNNPAALTKDTDYVFIHFVMDQLPVGIIGLLFAVIFCAAMSSTSSELNALAATSLVDVYKRSIRKQASDRHYLNMSKWITAGWGITSIIFATMFSLFDNLIEAVNIIGSLFYGTVLGVFTAGFFFRRLKSLPVFIGALLAELSVVSLFLLNEIQVIRLQYLWLNLIGCVLVLLFAAVVSLFVPPSRK